MRLAFFTVVGQFFLEIQNSKRRKKTIMQKKKNYKRMLAFIVYELESLNLFHVYTAVIR
jgi:hypothetical protein